MTPTYCWQVPEHPDTPISPSSTPTKPDSLHRAQLSIPEALDPPVYLLCFAVKAPPNHPTLLLTVARSKWHSHPYSHRWRGWPGITEKAQMSEQDPWPWPGASAPSRSRAASSPGSQPLGTQQWLHNPGQALNSHTSLAGLLKGQREGGCECPAHCPHGSQGLSSQSPQEAGSHGPAGALLPSLCPGS